MSIINPCWYELKLENTNSVIREDWNFPTPTEPNYGIWDLRADTIFNDNWLQYLQTLGLDLKYVMLFYRGPRFNRTTAHIDVCPPGLDPVEYSAGAINFVIQGKDSNMVWYKTPVEPKKVSFTKAKTAFLEWPVTELEEIERIHIGEKLILVRTNVPHTVEMGDEPRWCISIRSTNNGKISWEQLVGHFRERNLLIER